MSAGDLQVDNLDNGISYTPVALIPNAGLDTWTWVFNTPGNYISDGDYKFTLAANAVADPSANGNIGPFSLTNNTTFYLAGDANHDRKVNFDDLLILSQNYNTLGKDFSQGNFNYSALGEVTFDDLLILSQNYGASLFSATPIHGSSTRRDRLVSDILS